MRRRKAQLKPLSELIERACPPALEADTYRVFGWWNRSVPGRVARNAKPVSVYRGTLFVHTVSAVWANELEFMRNELLQSLRAELPNARVHDIRFRLGPLPDFTGPSPRRETTPVVAAQELPEALARALAHIADDGLRTTIARAAGASLSIGLVVK